MAVTNLGNSTTMTALGDASTRRVKLASIQFQGTGLTAGQRLRILTTGGNVIADYVTEAATDNAELLMNPGWFGGFKLEAGTVAGTWVVTFRFA